MTLLAIVIILLLVSQQWVPAMIRERRWARRYLVWFERQWRNRKWPLALQYGACVLPGALLFWAIDMAARHGVGRIGWLVASLFLLASLVDFRRIDRRLEELIRHWRHGEWLTGFDDTRIDDGSQRRDSGAEALAGALVAYWVQINRTLFSPILWYVVFGLGGLAFYLLGRTAAKNGYRGRGDEPARAWRKVAFEFQQVLDGASARLLTLSVGVLRLEPKALPVAIRAFRATDREAEGLFRMLMRVVLGLGDWPAGDEALASEGVRRARQMMALRNHLVMLWLSALAVLMLAGWLIH